MTEPTTAEGRALLGRLWATSDYEQASTVIAAAGHDILAIERAAAQAERARIRAAVMRAIDGFQNVNSVRLAVLAAIDEERSGE